MKKFGIDTILIIPFDEKFSSLSSHDFVQKIVVDRLKAKAVIVGENFRFGKNREGDIALLFRLASGYNLKVHSIPPVTKEDMIVSSSLIRNYLKEGKLEKANVLLGRFYEVAGKVIKGKSRGKSLGFPTANIKTENEIIPQGVFISTTGIGPETFSSLTNVGRCPTFNQKETNIESYIINLNKDIYGKKIRIHFLKKIRDEIKFKTQAELSQQIKKDLELAKSYFKL
jgi:riboflavin kinase/FMN adenylyltransferase